MLELTQTGLEKIARSKRKADAAHIGARVGKLLAKYKMGKFVTWEVKRRKLLWSVDQKKVKAEEVWDGCYVVRSDVPKAELAAAQTVAGQIAREFPMLFQRIVQPKLGRRPKAGFETFANDLAADSNSAIVIAVADILQQVRHLWK